MIALLPSIVVVEKPCAVEHHAHDAESGSDSNADYDCFVPLDAAEDHVDAEMGAQVNASALLADEHNPPVQQGQDESAPASEPPATHAATDFVKYDPCGNWGEHLRLMYKGKGKEREPVGYALPGGMQAIPGEGDCWMHDKSGFKPNYSKEVKTGVKGREHSTSTSEGPGGNFLPKERKGVIDMDKLKVWSTNVLLSTVHSMIYVISIIMSHTHPFVFVESPPEYPNKALGCKMSHCEERNGQYRPPQH